MLHPLTPRVERITKLMPFKKVFASPVLHKAKYLFFTYVRYASYPNSTKNPSSAFPMKRFITWLALLDMLTVLQKRSLDSPYWTEPFGLKERYSISTRLAQAASSQRA